MPDDLIGLIQETHLKDALSERYLAYALSTIMSRSLPDVRDGLKPVHRRLIYAMHQLRLDPTAGFKKCARVVGDVMGKYHPHGDASIYDAMVRMAQDFAARYPLVEGQGNFGNIDGDNPAAMRYTEARLTQVAQAMLAGIDEDAVDFRPTYDGEESEPIVLPGAFPNLLANGAAGIAVGMATSIPPHNAGEICAAAIHLIQHPARDHRRPAAAHARPRFPHRRRAGGGRSAPSWPPTKPAVAASGCAPSGRSRRASTAPGPSSSPKSPIRCRSRRLIEQVAQLMEDKKLPLLGDIRDESSDVIRLVLEPKTRGVEPEVLMETVFRATALETRFPLNMNVLDCDAHAAGDVLREVLRSWLDHRHEVLVRRSNHRLAAIERRMEVLDGYLLVYLNLDEVIRIIREEEQPKPRLIERFSLTDVQAEAILNMRLRSLRRLEEMEIRKEHKSLSKELKDLRTLLSERQAALGADHRGTGGDAARSSAPARWATGAPNSGAAPAAVEVNTDAFVEREPITVILSEKGWIRAVKGSVADPDELKFKEGDKLRLLLPCQTTDRLTLLATNGKAFTLKAADLPRGRGDGQPVRLLAELTNEDDIAALFVAVEGTRTWSPPTPAAASSCRRRNCWRRSGPASRC